MVCSREFGISQKPEECPNEMYEIMLKCWDKNPKNRPSFGVLYNEIYDLWCKLKHPEKFQATIVLEETMDVYALTKDEEHAPYQNIINSN